MKKIIALSLIAVLIATGFALSEVKRFPIPLENSPATGADNAPVTIVEFIDYQ